MCVCVCVCVVSVYLFLCVYVCVFGQHFFMETCLLKEYRCILYTYFYFELFKSQYDVMISVVNWLINS